MRPLGLLLPLVIASAAGGAGFTGADILKQDDAWLVGAEAQPLLANLLSFQTPEGGWCKAFDAHQPRHAQAGRGSYGGWSGTPTIDNGATCSEIRVLARAFALTRRAEYREAGVRGVDFLLALQYANGGWPQRPLLAGGKPRQDYGGAITFNDDAMVGVMRLLRDLGDGQAAESSIADEALRARASAAFARGVDCILACQIMLAGQPTGWCQQHDPLTLAPAPARAYELASVSGSESAGIVLLLMTIEHPDERVRRAIAGAAAWYEASRITGKRLTTRADPQAPKGEDRVLVDDPAAPPLWARFYDLDSNRPFFCRRDGVQRWTYDELDYERRNGYAWIGQWGEQVATGYTRWRERLAAER